MVVPLWQNPVIKIFNWVKLANILASRGEEKWSQHRCRTKQISYFIILLAKTEAVRSQCSVSPSLFIGPFFTSLSTHICLSVYTPRLTRVKISSSSFYSSWSQLYFYTITLLMEHLKILSLLQCCLHRWTELCLNWVTLFFKVYNLKQVFCFNLIFQ